MPLIAPTVGHVLESRFAVLVETLAAFAADHSAQLASDTSRDAFAALDAERDNFVAVLDSVLAAESLSVSAARLYLRLGRYLSIRGLWEEKRAWGLALLEHRTGQSRAILHNVAVATDDLGEHEQAAHLFETLLISAEQKGEETLSATLANLGAACWKLGRLDDAYRYTQRALALERELQDNHAVAQSLLNLAGIHYQRWEMDEALALVEEALTLADVSGDSYLIAQATSRYATQLVAALRFDEAFAVYAQALEMLAAVGDEIGMARTYFNFGLLCRIFNDYHQAAVLLRKALGILEHYGILSEASQARHYLNEVREKGGSCAGT